MKLYDGKKMVSIEMNNWTDNGYTPDWSIDFFEAGSLEYNEDMDAYIVEDVDYCIEQARDWQNARGDFYEPEVTFADIESRNVDVNEIKFVIKRTETYEGKDMVTYRQESGFFEKSKDTALRYSTYEDAEYAVELEQDDPKYDKSFMGNCRFEIEEV